jgi:Ca2+-binding RTX toxin-like protein
VRIRQIGLGDPAIRLNPNEPLCQANFVFNDVVCNRLAELVRIEGSTFDDEFVVGGSNQGCAPAPATPVTAILGDGKDVLRPSLSCVGDQSGINRMHPVFTAQGDDGSDRLTGGRANDTLVGGQGADEIDGQAGDDTLVDSTGVDQVNGSTGNDLFEAGLSTASGNVTEGASFGGLYGDVLDGGSGIDTVRYDRSGERISVSLDGAANDGAAGEGDNVRGIENVVAAGGNDTLLGSDAANQLDGSSGNDSITGGNGADTLLGGSGNDFIVARDNGTRDVVRCGDGFDEVVADLEDSVELSFSLLQPRTGGPACDRVERFAVDDGPPAEVANRSARIGADRSVRVTLACPRRARVTCRGTIRLVAAERGGHTLASARYRVKRGRRSAPVRLVLSAQEARRVRARGIVATVTREKGASKKGPRSATGTLKIRT